MVRLTPALVTVFKILISFPAHNSIYMFDCLMFMVVIPADARRLCAHRIEVGTRLLQSYICCQPVTSSCALHNCIVFYLLQPTAAMELLHRQVPQDVRWPQERKVLHICQL